jgi:DNA polymerase III delta prime subunit
MITNCFSVIRKNFIKKKLNQFIFFNNLNINKATYIKKIAIWLMCKKNNKSICTKCMSCLNFKKNTNTDYYEVIEDNDDNILLKIDFF